MFLFLCFTLSTVLFLLKWMTSTSERKKKNQPPSPPRLPLIGNLHNFGLHPHRSLKSLSERYGPLMLLHLCRVPVLVVSSADVARDVIKTHDRAFSSRPKSNFIDKLMSGGQDLVFAPYGEYWRQMKSIYVLHLLSNKMVSSFRNIREEEINLTMEKIEKTTSSSSSPANLSELFMILTNDVICRVALGKKYSSEEGMVNVRKLSGKLIGLFGQVYIGDYYPSLGWIDIFRGLAGELRGIIRDFDHFLEKVIREHSDGPREQVDFVDVLLSIQKENAVGFEIDRTSLKLLIADVFIAATDTTFALLEWAMTELLRHPECMEKLRAEIHTSLVDKSYVSEEDARNMKYLKAVIKETLRLHPSAPLLVPREVIEDVKLKGYDIKAGTQVLINYWAIGRETATWGLDAEEFKPERHLDSSVDFRGQDAKFIPFGAGRRICPGIGFALAMAESLLANAVYRFNWKIAVKPGRDHYDMAETRGLVVSRKYPLLAYANPASYNM